MDGSGGEIRADGRTGKGKFAPGHSGNKRGRRAREREQRQADAVETARAVADAARALDGWESILTGIGTSERDKRLSHNFTTDHVSYPEAIALWTSDDIAKRAIEAVPDACWREGYDIVIPDDTTGTVEWLESQIKRLGAHDAIRVTHKRERAFGGGGIVLGVNDGQTYDMPLNLAGVSEFQWLTPFEPIVMQPVRWYNDAAAAKYGQPSHYQISPMTFGISEETAIVGQTTALNLVHESRVIAFQGIKVSQYQAPSGTAGWGYSMFTRIRHVLRDFQVACASAGILAADFSQAIFSMEGLAGLAAKADLRQGANGLKNRLAAIELARSTARAILIDTKEKFERQTTNIQGLPELLAWLASRLAAAVEMPLTLLMGQSPKGLGNEGESDVRFYYDQIAAVQIEKVEPPLRRIIDILLHLRARGGEVPKKVEIKWRSLWQPSDKERAETHATQANADQVYVDMGALTADEVRDMRFGGEYSLETAVPDNGPTAGGLPPIPVDPETMVMLGREVPLGAPAATATAPVEKPPVKLADIIEIMKLVNLGIVNGGITRAQGIGALTVGYQMSDAEAEKVLGPPAPEVTSPPTDPNTPPPAPPAPTPTAGVTP